MSLESELQIEQVSHLNLSDFSRAESGTSVRDVLAQLRAEKHNVCLVTDRGQLIGIFTDRDVLRKVAGVPNVLDGPVDNVMTRNPISVRPDISAAEAMRIMDERRFRNLPVVDDAGNILGDMTHHAIIDYLAARYPIDVLNRPPEPDRFPRKPEGG